MKRPNIKINYCITRHGIIQFPKELASSNQCVIEGHDKYYYTCKIHTDNKKLDSQGFIVDHNDIDSTITKELIRKQFTGSCELMAEAMIALVIKMLKKKKQRFKSIEIILKGKLNDSPAFITANYINKKFK
jgi:hypothetical protein